MVAIVYQGAAGNRGDLFAGLKFFFLQRVPARQTYMEMVTSNGGEIVKIDKQADVIIADHARKDAPAGSISWTYIEKSVNGGRLEDKENHRAGPTTRTVREVSSAQPTRSGRTAFTSQDDRDLMIWVIKAERSGLSVKGNDIYKQLEEINPRHTNQSWRDRWVKILADRPRPQISEEEISAQPGAPVGNKYSNHPPSKNSRRSPTPDDEVIDLDAPRSIKQEPEVQPGSAVTAFTIGRQKPPANASSSKPVENKPIIPKTILPLVRKSTGGMNFTGEETDHMLDFYEVMAEADNKKGVNAWEKFAIENPNHSAQEWHNYFVQTIKPLMEEKQRRLQKPTPPSKEIQSLAKKTGSEQTKAQPSTNGDHEVRPPEPVEAQAPPKRFEDPSRSDEKLFTEELTAMAEDNDLEVNFNPVICGRKIPLFVLWQVVNLDEFGGYDEVTGRNWWSKIARRLNFNDFKQPDAPKMIKEAYEEVLADFEAAREEFMMHLEEEGLIESQLREMAERDSMEEELLDEEGEVVQEEGEEEDEYDDDLEAPASVPRQQYPLSSGKRSHEASQDGSPILGSYSKRQRFDKCKGKELEIPSTPEDIINPSPKPRSIYQSSPLKYMQTGADIDNGDDPFVGPVKKPKLPLPRQNHRNLEPETQDFNFTPVDDDAESESSLLSFPNQRKAKNGVPAAHSSSHEDSSTQSQTDSQKDQELIAFIDRHVGLGYRLEIVIEALESTSMTTGNAAIVMEALTSGTGIPDNIQGVWTNEDDAALDDVESEEFERVANKHGAKNLAQRQKFFFLKSEEAATRDEDAE